MGATLKGKMVAGECSSVSADPVTMLNVGELGAWLCTLSMAVSAEKWKQIGSSITAH